jgi:hypothetical protein
VWKKYLKILMKRCTGSDPFHRRQFGFRRKGSTVDAINQTMKFADTCKKDKQICIMLVLDIKNAFNTLRWESINNELGRRKLPWKIKRLINNFLMEKRVVVSNVFGTVEYEVSAGVPQGLVLGPLLWNLVYDQLLEKLDNMVTVKAFAFADDLAITCVVKKNKCPSTKVNVMLRIVSNWCASVGLTLARDKTEIMFITGMRVPTVIGLSVGNAETYSVEVIKYLGVIIDSYRKFDRHTVSVCDKANIMAGVFRGILPNINGKPSLARRLYYNVWKSIAMYGAPV